MVPTHETSGIVVTIDQNGNLRMRIGETYVPATVLMVADEAEGGGSNIVVKIPVQFVKFEHVLRESPPPPPVRVLRSI
jgi:hypothetical protein